MSFCEGCGHPRSENRAAKFCGKCGHPTPSPEEAETTAPAAVATPAPSATVAEGNQSAPKTAAVVIDVAGSAAIKSDGSGGSQEAAAEPAQETNMSDDNAEQEKADTTAQLGNAETPQFAPAESNAAAGPAAQHSSPTPPGTSRRSSATSHTQTSEASSASRRSSTATGGVAKPKKWPAGQSNADTHSEVPLIIRGVKKLYREKILPLEKLYKFDEFHSPSLTDTDFEAKPIVLLMGQYSTGKTTFIKYLLERDFPGGRIGPEPTTDRFVCVMHGKQDAVIPGNALVVQRDKPFTALARFGMTFLNRLECSQCDSPILEKISFVDTPGVLSGEKQRIGRAYDFPKVIEWFAERADRILLLFDAHKLDISDEFKRAIESLAGHGDKIRCILNKADSINRQQLQRVYGALMWSLGKVIKTPEVLRVYIGSFWDQPLQYKDNEQLLAEEEADLLADLRSLPRNSAVRKVNELIKRARMSKVHALIVTHLRDQFGWFGREKTQEKLLANLIDEFKKVQAKHNLPLGDFPHVKRFRISLKRYQIHMFPKLDKVMLEDLDDVLSKDIPRLMRLLPSNHGGSGEHQTADGSNDTNPFDVEASGAQQGGSWVIDEAMKTRFENEFRALNLTQGKLSGNDAKEAFSKSQLGNGVLRKVWNLSDIDRDGHLDADEFAVAMFLIQSITSGQLAELPSKIPPSLVPPSKRLS